MGQGHFGCSAPVCSVPVPGTEPAALSVPLADAAGPADLPPQLPELADWLERLRERRELRGLRWTAARRRPGAAPGPAVAAAAAAPAVKPSAAGGGGQGREEDREVEEEAEKMEAKCSEKQAKQSCSNVEREVSPLPAGSPSA